MSGCPAPGLQAVPAHGPGDVESLAECPGLPRSIVARLTSNLVEQVVEPAAPSIQ